MSTGHGSDAAPLGPPARRDPRIEQHRSLPPHVRAASPMADLDDVDLTIVSGTVARASAERWMRATAEDFFRARANRAMLRGLLGLRLAPASSPDHLGGWAIAEDRPDRIRLEARGWLLEANLVLAVEPDGAWIASFVRYRHPLARLVWGRLVAPSHRQELRTLLAEAARRLAREADLDPEPLG